MRAHELEESAVEDLKNRLPKLKDKSYNNVDRLMQHVCTRHKITGKKLHDMFVSKYGHTPDTWVKKITNRLKEQGVTEISNDHIQGPQGRFAGDTHVDAGRVSMNHMKVGDIVRYLGEKAKILELSKDEKRARIEIHRGMGGIVQTVLTSDLKQSGQGVALEGSKEQEYGPSWDAMVNRLGQQAKEGERKTIWDPIKRVYRTVPVNAPKTQSVAEGASIERKEAFRGRTTPDIEYIVRDEKNNIVRICRTKKEAKLWYDMATLSKEEMFIKYPELKVNESTQLSVATVTNQKKNSKVVEGVEGPKDIEKIKHFIKWSCKTLNIQKPYPKITISKDTEKAQEGHRTGMHSGNDIWVYVANRNLIDIFRTIFHELTHHRQMQLNMIKIGDSYPGSPIEMLADMAAGKFIKIYGKDHPEIFQ